MMNNLSQDVRFDLIRYANCWEDAYLLMEACSPMTNDRVLSIASAGDNSFSFLHYDVQKVTAVDISLDQIYLCEIKKSGIRNLARTEFLEFIGVAPSNDRWNIYLNRIRPELTDEIHQWVIHHKSKIHEGIIFMGKFERYFSLFRNYIMPFIHNKQTISELFRMKSTTEQHEFYHTKWNTWLWKKVFYIFFSKLIMGKYGRDPQFLIHVGLPSVAEYIFNKAELELSSCNAQHNFMLDFIFNGNYTNAFPLYLTEAAYPKIQANIDRIEFKQVYIDEYAISQNIKFDIFNLSNIFEYMDIRNFNKCVTSLISSCNHNARLAYWNLMVPRKIHALDQYQSNEINLSNLKQDYGFFYDKLYLYKHQVR